MNTELARVTRKAESDTPNPSLAPEYHRSGKGKRVRRLNNRLDSSRSGVSTRTVSPFDEDFVCNVSDLLNHSRCGQWFFDIIRPILAGNNSSRWTFGEP